MGWVAYTKNPNQLKKAFKNSLKVWSVWDSDELVGIARIVGDGQTIIYIQDILVLEKYQGLGICSKLIEIIMDEYKSVRQILLLTDDSTENIKFYKKNGLKEVAEYNCIAFMI